MVGSGCWKSTKLKVGHGRVNERARAAEVSNYTQNGAPEKRSGRTGIEDSMRARAHRERWRQVKRAVFGRCLLSSSLCPLRTSPNPTSLSFERRNGGCGHLVLRLRGDVGLDVPYVQNGLLSSATSRPISYK